MSEQPDDENDDLNGFDSDDEDVCFMCGGEGYVEHQCDEDTCCCLNPEDDVCPECGGKGRP